MSSPDTSQSQEDPLSVLSKMMGVEDVEALMTEDKPDDAPAGEKPTDELDLFSMLNAVQGNRLDKQRSSAGPELTYHMDLSSSSSASNKHRSPSSSKLKAAFFKKKGSEAKLYPPLKEVCSLYLDSNDGIKSHPEEEPSGDDGNVLVERCEGWKLETYPRSAPHVPSTRRGVQMDEHGVELFEAGVSFYRDYFYGQDHVTLVGIDETLGHVVISLRREVAKTMSDGSEVYQYRIILRSTNGGTQRLVVAEEQVPSKGESVTAKDVIERVIPELQPSKLRQSRVDSRLADDILRLDECNTNITKSYKIGLMNCQKDQSTEHEMYNNAKGSQDFDDFLTVIGERVKLNGFTGFRGGLDVEKQQTGEESVFVTFGEYQIMYHVATLLPLSDTDDQQVLRKRHIGNDIVTVIFQDEGARPVDIASFRSKFHHAFIIVRVRNGGTPNMVYTIASVRKTDVPFFNPDFYHNEGSFSYEDIANGTFRKSLLTKIINSENACNVAGHLGFLAARTRVRLLEDVVTTYMSDMPIPGVVKKSSLVRLIVPRANRRRSSDAYGDFVKNAHSWEVKLEHGSKATHVTLAMSSLLVLVVEDKKQSAIHNFPTSSVIGWTFFPNGLRIWYGKNEETLDILCSGEAAKGITDHLKEHSPGCLILDIEMRRSGASQPWGFTVHNTEIVNVIPGGVASNAGLTTDHRLFRINGLSLAGMSEAEIVEAAQMKGLTVDLTVKVLEARPDALNAGASTSAPRTPRPSDPLYTSTPFPAGAAASRTRDTTREMLAKDAGPVLSLSRHDSGAALSRSPDAETPASVDVVEGNVDEEAQTPLKGPAVPAAAVAAVAAVAATPVSGAAVVAEGDDGADVAREVAAYEEIVTHLTRKLRDTEGLLAIAQHKVRAALRDNAVLAADNEHLRAQIATLTRTSSSSALGARSTGSATPMADSQDGEDEARSIGLPGIKNLQFVSSTHV